MIFDRGDESPWHQALPCSRDMAIIIGRIGFYQKAGV